MFLFTVITMVIASVYAGPGTDARSACVDSASWCGNWRSSCHVPKYANYMKRICAETCGYCNSGCVNTNNDEWCHTYQKFCEINEEVGQACARTCGVCSSGPGSAPRPIATIRPPVTIRPQPPRSQRPRPSLTEATVRSDMYPCNSEVLVYYPSACNSGRSGKGPCQLWREANNQGEVNVLQCAQVNVYVPTCAGISDVGGNNDLEVDRRRQGGVCTSTTFGSGDYRDAVKNSKVVKQFYQYLLNCGPSNPSPSTMRWPASMGNKAGTVMTPKELFCVKEVAQELDMNIHGLRLYAHPTFAKTFNACFNAVTSEIE